MTANSASTHASGLPPAVVQWLLEANRALSRNQVGLAQQSLAKALAAEPDCAEALRLMGIAALIGNHRDAIDYLQRALAASPEDSTLCTNLGSALFEIGETDAGLGYLQRACELAPGSASTWYNLARRCNSPPRWNARAKSSVRPWRRTRDTSRRAMPSPR